MGQGALASLVGPTDHSYQTDRVYPLLPYLRADVVLPVEIGYASPRVRAYDEHIAEEALQDSLDRLDEHHGTTLVRFVRYQQQLRKYHSKHVQPLNFMKGDLVLRRVQTKGKNKFTPPWEGPFIMAKVLKSGTYKLANMNAQVYMNSWNVDLLQRFYV
jgi:hypothetical protein